MARVWANVSQQWVVTSKCINCCRPTVLSAMLANNYSTAHPCVLPFLSWLSSRALAQHSSYPLKEFLTRAARTRLAASSTRMQCSAGSRTCPANAGICKLHGLTCPVQDSSLYQTFGGAIGGRMVRSSSQMDNSILFAEFLELLRFEGSSAINYNCMGKTEMRKIFLQELDRWLRWY